LDRYRTTLVASPNCLDLVMAKLTQSGIDIVTVRALKKFDIETHDDDAVLRGALIGEECCNSVRTDASRWNKNLRSS